jgi:hypothetical protein
MRTQQGLENKLDAYEATWGEERLTRKGRRRNWRMYAAAAGSGLAMTTSAEAGIINYSGALNETATAGVNATSHWNASIDGGKLVGFALLQSIVFPPFFSLHRGAAELNLRGGVSVLLNNSNQVAHLSSGQKISHGAGIFGGSNDGSAALRGAGGGTVGTWAKSQPGFAGIKVGGDYGWVELKWGASAGGLPNSITLLGWAYDETPGEAINAGQTVGSAAPEPSTGLMALLATGCVGVAAWRKRRAIPRQAATA